VDRNIRGFGLSPGIKRADRAAVEKLVRVRVWLCRARRRRVALMSCVGCDVVCCCALQVVSALNSLEGDLAGKYYRYPLTGMSEADLLDLESSHFLFKRGDRFLESAGASRDWPGV
jgi:creatine kinase